MKRRLARTLRRLAWRLSPHLEYFEWPAGPVVIVPRQSGKTAIAGMTGALNDDAD